MKIMMPDKTVRLVLLLILLINEVSVSILFRKGCELKNVRKSGKGPNVNTYVCIYVFHALYICRSPADSLWQGLLITSIIKIKLKN